MKPVAASFLLAVALLGGCRPGVDTAPDRVGQPAANVPVVVGGPEEIDDIEIGDLESELEALEDYMDELEAMLEDDLPMAP